MCVCVYVCMSEWWTKEGMLGLEGVLQIVCECVCVCSYGCALCGVTGEKNRNVEKKVRNMKNKQKKAAIVFDQPEHSGSTWLE